MRRRGELKRNKVIGVRDKKQGEGGKEGSGKRRARAVAITIAPFLFVCKKYMHVGQVDNTRPMSAPATRPWGGGGTKQNF